MKVIGLSGTNGSGKDTAGKLLAERYNLLFVSVSDFLREEARSRGLPVTREVLRTISAEWRRESGLGTLVDRAVALARSFGDRYEGVVAVPMRNVGEAQRVKDLGGIIVWIHAESKIRYQRIQSNDRGRKGEDDKTYQQFLAEEQAEMVQAGDAATLNMSGVKQMADVFIANDSKNIEDFQVQMDQKLNSFLTKNSTQK
jgi:cytidylate kinase